jgi:hypothetical protein
MSWRVPFALGLIFVFAVLANSSPALDNSNDIVGRWDLSVGEGATAYPSWLEVTRKDGKLAGRFVGRVGSARPIKQIEFAKGALSFSLPPQYEKRKTDLSFSGNLSDSGVLLRGKTTGEDGNHLTWRGVRAPALAAPANPKWGKPIPLFNGKDVTGWQLKDPKLPNGWKAVNGVLENHMPSSDIVSERKFTDFKLHVEFNVAPKSNSGVYLRGRYEIQIQDDFGKAPGSLLIGGLYGFLEPTENAGKKADEWQSYDITLLGRFVTIVLNGKTVIDNKEIPGITGGALDSREGEPGPLMLQGDHGKVLFRNIFVTPVVSK